MTTAMAVFVMVWLTCEPEGSSSDSGSICFVWLARSSLRSCASAALSPRLAAASFSRMRSVRFLASVGSKTPDASISENNSVTSSGVKGFFSAIYFLSYQSVELVRTRTFELHSIVTGIGAATGEKLLVRTTFHNATMLDGRNLVGMFNGRETVGDDDRGATAR